MRTALCSELETRAKAYEKPTALSTLVLEALADKQLQLHAAIRTRLAKSGKFTITVTEKPDSQRVQCEVRDSDKTLVAWSDSVSEELAIEHAMLGAMREGR